MRRRLDRPQGPCKELQHAATTIGRATPPFSEQLGINAVCAVSASTVLNLNGRFADDLPFAACDVGR